jgi:hypothetical protein
MLMLNEDGLLDWFDDKRRSDSPLEVNGVYVCRAMVEKRRGPDGWTSALWFYLEICDDDRDAAKEATQAFLDQHPEVLAALAVIRAAENKFNARRVAGPRAR